MIEEAKKISFEDIFIGQKENFSTKITESMVDEFSEFSGDFNPLHIDNEYAASSTFGKRIVHGMLLASFFSRLVGMYLPGKNAIYFSQNLNFVGPCYIGDKVTVQGEIIDKSEATKIIKLKTSIKNQEGTSLIEGTSQIMVR